MTPGRASRDLIATLVSWLVIGVAAFAAIWSQRPPAPLPASASVSEFSATRAISHLDAIARVPRPIGSANHSAARDYIFQQLQALGLEVEIQKTTATAWVAPSFVAGSIENVVARRRGATGGRSVLLVAHYDSVPTGPGANDDGVGVATLLETARAIVAMPQLPNDVVLLFSDAEETGLLGARAFVAEHPWAKEVAIVLNFESRGNGGPVIMFETSPRNGALIRGLAQATSYPLANSLSYEIYKRLPNNTDLTVFKESGLSAMNFAYIHGLTHYHTALDNLENVDPRTVQHHGSYALALSCYFAADATRTIPEQDAIYFDLLGFLLARYPSSLAWPLTVATLLLFAAVVWLGFQRKQLTARGIAGGALLFLFALIAAAGLVGGAWWLARKVHPESDFITNGDSYRHGYYVLGFALLTLASTGTVLGSFTKKIGESNLFVGALLFWASSMVALTTWIVGGSYLVTWPLLFSLIGVGYGFMKRRSAGPVLAAFCAIPGVLLIVPFVHLVLIAMPFSLAPALIAPLVLLFALLIPLLRRSTAQNRWVFPLVTAGGALLCFVVAGAARIDKDHRRANHLLYILDAPSQQAFWVSSDPKPDGWTRQFFGAPSKRAPLAHPFPLSRRDYLQATAPVVAFTPPEAVMREDVTANGVRHLRLHLSSPRGAERLSAEVNAEIVNAAVDGKPLLAGKPERTARKTWSLIYLAVPREGLDLVLETKSPPPLIVKLVDESYGLPLGEGAGFRARPADTMPAPLLRSDFSLVGQNYSF